jgi:hypothetical protein
VPLERDSEPTAALIAVLSAALLAHREARVEVAAMLEPRAWN